MKIRPILLCFSILILFVALSDNKAHTQKAVPPTSNKKSSRQVFDKDSVFARLDSILLLQRKLSESIDEAEKIMKGEQIRNISLNKQSAYLDREILKMAYRNQNIYPVDFLHVDFSIGLNPYSRIDSISIKRKK